MYKVGDRIVIFHSSSSTSPLCLTVTWGWENSKDLVSVRHTLKQILNVKGY